MNHHILSLLIFIPLIGACLILALPGEDKTTIRYSALATSLVAFSLSCLLVAQFDPSATQLQFVEHHRWIESLKISYFLGVDGLSIPFMPVIALLFMLAIVGSWNIQVGLKGYFGLLLLLETTILGAFCAQDLFLLLAFWQMSILPVYFMIGIWGHQNRVSTANKFFVVQLCGSVLLLFGALLIYFLSELNTFSIPELAGAAASFWEKRIEVLGHSISFAKTAFIILLLGFATRLPVFPFHSWFVATQSEAPTVVAAIVAALYIKLGAYGLLRVNYLLFPRAAHWMSLAISIGGGVNVIYGALCARGHNDLRRILAYMCLSQMGFVLLGLGVFSQTAFHGALLQMLVHSFYAGLLFFLVGLLGERAGNFQIFSSNGDRNFGGLVLKVPLLTGFFTVGIFAALGAPGFGSFPALALLFVGMFPVHVDITMVGLVGVLLTASYMLWMYRHVFLGSAPKSAELGSSAVISDLTVQERIYLTPLVILSVVIGVYPTPFIHFSASTVTQILAVLTGGGQ